MEEDQGRIKSIMVLVLRILKGLKGRALACTQRRKGAAMHA